MASTDVPSTLTQNGDGNWKLETTDRCPRTSSPIPTIPTTAPMVIPRVMAYLADPPELPAVNSANKSRQALHLSRISVTHSPRRVQQCKWNARTEDDVPVANVHAHSALMTTRCPSYIPCNASVGFRMRLLRSLSNNLRCAWTLRLRGFYCTLFKVYWTSVVPDLVTYGSPDAVVRVSPE